MKISLCGFIFLFSMVASAFHEVQKFPLSGKERWDYLTQDSAEHRIYITRGTRVSVLDTQDGKLLGEIKDLQGVHGVALVKSLQTGFISDGKGNAVVVFDLKDFKKLATIPVGTNPDSILYDPFSKMIFAFNGKSKDISVINPETRKVEHQIKLKGKPETAVSDQKGSIYLNLEDTNEIVKINSKEMKIEKTYALKSCEEPAGLAINPKTSDLFIGCGNGMVAIFNPTEGKILRTVVAAPDADAVAYDASLKTVFASTGEGPLSIIQLDEKDQPLKTETVKASKGSHTMAFNGEKGEIYVVEAKFAPPASGDAAKGPRPQVEEGSCFLHVYKN